MGVMPLLKCKFSKRPALVNRNGIAKFRILVPCIKYATYETRVSRESLCRLLLFVLSTRLKNV